ncbi:chitin deacetylase [Gryganskiella cystojenkinii]|nr:chitin deacetylase [Gryganskiella cystojenkinii]
MLSTSISGLVTFLICFCLLFCATTVVQSSPAVVLSTHHSSPSVKLTSPPTSAYPPRGRVPPLDSPEVKQWLQEIDLSGAPTLALNKGEPPSCESGWSKDPKSCYSPCQNCYSDDVIVCPEKDVWGLTFDDGPSTATPTLLDFLELKKLKATFFLIGGNVIQYPELVKRESLQGHHLASHTWSHHALTTLTNQQIVAEMKWTEKAIMDATGVKVRYMRPPYGDVDNRVRYVLKQMGYVVVDWTDTFDTLDWEIPMHQRTAAQATGFLESSIQKYLAQKASQDKPGFISLEHDLAVVNIGVAKDLITYGLNKHLNIQSIADCLHDSNPYAAVNYVPGQNGITSGGPITNGTTISTNPQNNNSGTEGLDLAQKGHANSAGSRNSPRNQHFLGHFLSLSPSSSTADVHSATLQIAKLTVEKVAWSGIVLSSFVAGLATL